MKKEKQKKNRPVASIGWKLIVYFAIFVAVALLVMWVFQVYLLNNFYELIKRREMAHSATELANYIETEDLNIHAYDQALDGVMAVAIYQVDRGIPKQVISVNTMTVKDILPTCRIVEIFKDKPNRIIANFRIFLEVNFSPAANI